MMAVRQELESVEPSSSPPSAVARIGLQTLARRVVQMVGWRFLALSFSAVGSIWAARCLGPQKLGISGMIAATITQLVLLVDLNQNAHLIRLYKGAASDEARQRIVGTVFTFRMMLCIAVMVVAGLILMFVHIPPTWRMGLLASFPLFFVTCNQGIWVVQAQENQPAQYRAGAAQGLVAASAYLVFFRPGIAPGWDVLVQAVAVGTNWLLLWRSVGSSFAQLWRPADWFAALGTLKEGRWLMITGIVAYVYTQLESPLIGYLTSIEEIGRYRSATTLVAVAQSFLAMVPILLYPRFLEWLKVGRHMLWQRQIQLSLFAIAIALPAAMVAYSLAPLLYRTLYGAAFAAAATPFTLLLASKFVVVVNGIFAWGLWAMKKDKQMLAIMIVAAAFSITANLILIPRFGMLAAAAVNLSSEFVILGGCFWLTRRAIRQSSNS